MSKCHVMCCVKGCTNRLKTDSSLHFYKFPKKSIYTPWRMEKRNLWIEAVRPYVKIPANKDRNEWDPKDRAVICSAHFINGAKGEHPRDPAYLPTIFPKLRIKITTTDSFRFLLSPMENREKIPQSPEIQPMQVSEPEQDTPEFLIEPSSPNVSCQAGLDLNNDAEISTSFCTLASENNINTAAVQVNLVPTSQKSSESQRKKAQTREIGCNTSEPSATLSRGFHGFSSIRTNEEAQQMCGVSLSTFEFLLKSLPEMDNLDLSKSDLLLLFLMKMRLGLSFTCLGIFFDVHSVPEIFEKVLRFLARELSKCTFWPKRQTVRESLPEAFRDNYKNCRVVIDCLEFKIETPVTLRDKNLTWSENKRIYTFKVLAGCTPNGFISFASKSYTGGMSDNFVANDCGLLDKLEGNDLVMVSKKLKGIEMKGRKKKISVVSMPSFLPKIQGFQRIKQFQIFKLITEDLFPHVDDMVTVACGLVNLEGSGDLDKEKRFLSFFS